MKIFVLFLFSGAFLISGCDSKIKIPVQDSSVNTINFPKGGTILYRVVVLDGHEYYASRTNGGFWVIGPKKESK